MGNVGVAAAIQAAQSQRVERVKVEADEILRGLLRIARADMRKYATWGPAGVVLRASSELTEEEAAAVAELSQTVSEGGGSIRFKLHDKLSALDKLARHLNLFRDTLELHGNVKLQLVEELVDANDPQDNPTAPGAAGIPPE